MQFNRGGESWEKQEDDQLIKEYNVDKLTILELSKLHGRTPGGIISRLVRTKIIDKRDNVRGYLEYKNSDLYKEICKRKSEECITKITAASTGYLIDDTDIISPTVTSSPIESKKEERKKMRLLRKQVPYDLADVKNDMKDVKEKVNKIIELLTAVYDFEHT